MKENYYEDSRLAYEAYFRDVEPIKQESWCNSLEQHSITICKTSGKTETRLDYLINGGRVVHFTVSVGRFEVGINVLNLDGRGYKQVQMVGGGSFGQIIEGSVAGQPVIIKRIAHFNSRHSINEILKEYAFYKICSMMKIGPSVAFSTNVDLVIFEDFAEFIMERCEPYSRQLIEQLKKYRDIRMDILQCVRTLHAEGIKHMDIKPDNIVFSKKLNRFVLTDFGISRHSDLEPGFKEKVWFSGTMNFVCPEMLKLLETRQIGPVDLHYNDMWAVQETLKCMGLSSININPTPQDQISERVPLQPSECSIKIELHVGSPKKAKKKLEYEIPDSDEECYSKKRVRSFSSSDERIGAADAPYGLVNRQSSDYVPFEHSLENIYDFYNLLFGTYGVRQSPSEMIGKWWERLTGKGRRLLLEKVEQGGSNQMDFQVLFNLIDIEPETQKPKTSQLLGKQFKENVMRLNAVTTNRSEGMFEPAEQLLTKQSLKLYRRCVVYNKYLQLHRILRDNQPNTVLLTSIDVQDKEDEALKFEPAVATAIQKKFKFNVQALCNFLRRYPYLSRESKRELFQLFVQFASEGTVSEQHIKWSEQLNLILTCSENDLDIGQLQIGSLPYIKSLCLFVVAFERLRSRKFYDRLVQTCRQLLKKASERKVDAACLHYLSAILENRSSQWEKCITHLQESLKLLRNETSLEPVIERNVLTTQLEVFCSLGMNTQCKELSWEIAQLGLVHFAREPPMKYSRTNVKSVRAKMQLNDANYVECERLARKMPRSEAASKRDRHLQQFNSAYILACSLTSQNELSAALSMVERVLQQPDEGDMVLQRMRALLELLKIDILMRQNNHQQALQLLTARKAAFEAIQDKDICERMLYMESQLLNRLKQHGLAQRLCGQAISLRRSPGNPTQRFRMGLILLEQAAAEYKIGMKVMAIKSLQRAVDFYMKAEDAHLHQLQEFVLVAANLFFRMKRYKQCSSLAMLLFNDKCLLPLINIHCKCLLALSNLFLKQPNQSWRYGLMVIDQWRDLPANMTILAHACLKIVAIFSPRQCMPSFATINSILENTSQPSCEEDQILTGINNFIEKDLHVEFKQEEYLPRLPKVLFDRIMIHRPAHTNNTTPAAVDDSEVPPPVDSKNCEGSKRNPSLMTCTV